MSNLRKNQIKSLVYQILIAFVTYIFMMGKYIYYAMPYTVGIFLLMFISLGMTLKYINKPFQRFTAICAPMILNTALLVFALIGAGGFIDVTSGKESLYFVPLHMLNPNITFMPYFINHANILFKYFMIIITPSFLMYLGMYLGNITRQKLKARVNKFDIKKQFKIK